MGFATRLDHAPSQICVRNTFIHVSQKTTERRASSLPPPPRQVLVPAECAPAQCGECRAISRAKWGSTSKETGPERTDPDLWDHTSKETGPERPAH